MAIRVLWSEEEAALLLNTLLDVLANKISRPKAVASVSKKLRMLAQLNGIKIDEKYRNENGIALQMSKLEYAFTGGKSGLAVSSGWHFRIVEIYKNDRKRFELLLNNVSSLDKHINKVSGCSPNAAIGLETADCAKQISFFDVFNDDVKEPKPVFKPYNDNCLFSDSFAESNFNAVDFTPYRQILSMFSTGFRILSQIDMRRFRKFWLDKYNKNLSENDDTVRKYIKHITIQYKDFVYLPEALLDTPNTERLLAYLQQCFNDGKKAVYFDAVYKAFQRELSGTHINNSEMLKIYLEHINKGKGNYFIHKNYVTVSADAEVNLADEIRDYLITAGEPITVDNLKNALSHIAENEINEIVTGRNSAEFIRNQKGEYFHADSICFTQPEIDTITNLIQSAIDDKGYMGGKELIDEIKIGLPAILDRYPFFTWLGLRDVIAYKLRDMFSFKGKIISTYGQNLSMTDVFAHFAATHEHFTLEDLKLLKQDLDTKIYFDAVYANSLRINKNEFVSRDKQCFNVESTDIAISRFCTGDYIALKEISFFGSFPDAGFRWNPFLLEHYVADFSKKYKLLHLDFIASTPVGAIVKRSSRFEKFNEIISAELAVSNISLSIDNALQYLVEKGFLALKKYTEIEQILSQAKLQRAKKG